jgi:hypothetical protein
VEPLPSSDLETEKETTFAAGQQIFNKQIYAAVADRHVPMEMIGTTMERLFSTWSVLRGYKRDAV